MPLMIEGVATMVNLAMEINKALGRRQIKNIDIGGGLSVNFDDERDETDVAITFNQYADMLRKSCPALFTGEYRVFTEFGRRINAKPGFIVSRVEYNKDAGTLWTLSFH
jgi:diaminopimelate decarboxylase